MTLQEQLLELTVKYGMSNQCHTDHDVFIVELKRLRSNKEAYSAFKSELSQIIIDITENLVSRNLSYSEIRLVVEVLDRRLESLK